MWRKFAQLAAWNTLSVAIDRVGVYAAIIFLAVILSPEDYGRWGILYSFVLAVQLFSLIGSTAAILKYVPQYVVREPAVSVATIRFGLGLSVVASAAISFATIWFFQTQTMTMFENEKSVYLTILLVVGIFVLPLNEILRATALAMQQGRILGFSSIFYGPIAAVLIPLGAYQFGYLGALAGYLIAEVIRFVVLAVLNQSHVFKKLGGLRGPIKRADVARVLPLAIPVFLQSALYTPVLWAGQAWVATSAPVGLEEVAIFSLGMSAYSMTLMMSGQINTPLLPIVATLAADSKWREAFDAIRRAAIVQSCAAAIIGILILPVFWLVMPEVYRSGFLALTLIVISGVQVSLQNALGNMLLIADRSLSLFLTMLPWAMIYLGCVIALPVNGSLALALGLFFGGGVRTLLISGLYLRARAQLIASGS